MATLSRKTVKILADLYVETFTPYRSNRESGPIRIRTEALYGLVFEHDGNAWLCTNLEQRNYDTSLRSFILKLHTGESVNQASWSVEARETYGQARLIELCTAILSADSRLVEADDLNGLRSALELDGYVFRDGVEPAHRRTGTRDPSGCAPCGALP